MDDCSKHAGHYNGDRRTPHDNVMRGLPENQSGAGRHKCPYCAYEQGIKHGIKQGLRRACEAIGKLDTD